MSKVLIALCALLVVYFLPALVALVRRNRDLQSVFLINLWLGWTVIGWITAMGWALDRTGRRK
ncbi:MAG TPA: superinfection immunity protein [Candidatus Binataceae bacterium]|nr:superinfection immunity protein [Candidatus Binataceae bacterium]